MKPKNLFREMRLAWFFKVLYFGAPDRVWEDDEAEARRMEINDRMRADYDADTEAILRGEDRMLAPRCLNDLGEKR
ncbi:MAG: hypothetical protein ACYTFQ_03305 [Planctomycetota bacterium]|jgi:hypothetical protein